MYETACAEQQFGVFVADGVDLCEILLIVRRFINEPAAAEYLDVINQAFQHGVVDSALYVCVVTDAAVGPDNFREGIFEPFRETVWFRCELYDMHEITELCSAVIEPFGTKAEFRIYCLDMVSYLFKRICFVASCIDVLNWEFS